MTMQRLGIFGLMTIAATLGCSRIRATPLNFLTSGAPFIVSGTTAVIDNNGPCLVWMGDNGEVFHLFQGLGLDNETFDRVTTPGTRSRLQLGRRNDLTVSCQVGTIVEIQDVLEIIE